MFEKEIKDGEACPYLGGKACIKAKCKMWISIKGQHPQNGEMMDQWDCAIKWQPLLTLEVAKQQRSNTVATESYRNEVFHFTNALAQMINENGRTRLAPHTPKLENGDGQA